MESGEVVSLVDELGGLVGAVVEELGLVGVHQADAVQECSVVQHVDRINQAIADSHAWPKKVMSLTILHHACHHRKAGLECLGLCYMMIEH